MHISLLKIATQTPSRVQGRTERLTYRHLEHTKAVSLNAAFMTDVLILCLREISFPLFKLNVASITSLGFSKIGLPSRKTSCIWHKGNDLARAREMCEQVK